MSTKKRHRLHVYGDEIKSKFSNLGYKHSSLSFVNFALEPMNRRTGTNQRISLTQDLTLQVQIAKQLLCIASI